MEYEQLEEGKKLIERAIMQQDVGKFYDLLSPDVLCISHFPYPEKEEMALMAAFAVRHDVLKQTQNVEALRRKHLRQQAQQLAEQQARFQTQHFQSAAAASGLAGPHTINNGNASTTSNNHHHASNGAGVLTAEAEQTAAAAAPSTNTTTQTGKATSNKSRTQASNTTMGTQQKSGGSSRKAAQSVSPARSRNAAATTTTATTTAAASRTASNKPLGVDAGLIPTREVRGVRFYCEVLSAANTAPPAPAAAAANNDAAANEPPAATANNNNNVNNTTTTTATAAAVTDKPAAAAASSATTVNNKKKASPPSAPPEEMRYGDYVDIAEGRELAAARLGFILAWLNTKKYVAEIKVQFKPRKSILQDSEVLPPPPTPQTERERYELIGRQHTSRNQLLSRLIVTWGSENLLFRDECFFDDGYVVTIQRHMLGMQEMLEQPIMLPRPLTVAQRMDQIRQEVRTFYGAAGHKLSTVHNAWPLLDFSFCELNDPLDLLQRKPCSGKPHSVRGLRPTVDPHLAQGVFLNQDNDPSQVKDSAHVLIKARNKKGEEEAYEFYKDRQRYSFFGGAESGAKGLNSIDALVDGITERYDACCVRIGGCKTLSQRMDKFAPVLRGLVANAFLTVRALDLSDNGLVTLPDVSAMPLQKLYLHANSIRDWREVEERVAGLPLLYAVSLHGNPLSEHNTQYWQQLLALLLGHPARLVKLRQVDFVTLSAQDYSLACTYAAFTKGNSEALTRIKAMAASVIQ